MNNNQKEICPIEYMIASRRPKRKRSMAQRLKKNKAIIQKMLIASGVFSVLTVGTIYSSELCDMTKKMFDNITPNTKLISLTEEQKRFIKDAFDSNLIEEIREQEARGKDYVEAAYDALSCLSQVDEIYLKNGKMPVEVYFIRSEQYQKRFYQFEQFDWSNIDRNSSMNPYIDMIIKERNGIIQDEYQNEVSCIRRNTSISQNNQNLYMALRGNMR